MEQSVVYQIINTLNGQSYVGITNDVFKRWKRHTSLLKKSKHPNWKLQASWNKFGQSTFEIKVLEAQAGLTKAQMSEMERSYIAKFKSYEYGFNLSQGGEVLTAEGRRKVSEAKKGKKSGFEGKKQSNETKQKLRISSTGLTSSEETRRKKSEANRGRVQTPEQVARMLENRKVTKGLNVLCLDTGEIFKSPKHASAATGIKNRKIARVCRGECGSTGGLSFRYIKAP